jgi:metallo-beta-lactamase family protein
MQVTFHGAAGEVTGSQHLFENKEHRILLDCGLFQGKRQETYDKNRHPDYEASTLDAILVSHAHLDHTGKLPRLARLGFEGPVYATDTTVALLDPMLKDSAHIQMKDLEFVNKLHRKKGKEPFNLLYDDQDVAQLLSQVEGQPLNQSFEVVPEIKATFIEAGHVLGSAQILLEIKENGQRLRVGYTGDLGRTHLPILKDPDYHKDLDVLLIESTYGNRDHDPISESGPELLEVIHSTYEKGGKLIIPAFALERTQELLYLLAQL